MINTEKGKKLFDKVSANIEKYPCLQEDIAKKQPNMYTPSSYSNKVAGFQADMGTMEFKNILKKYTRVGIKRRLIDAVKRILK